jgi:hypothetical protein
LAGLKHKSKVLSGPLLAKESITSPLIEFRYSKTLARDPDRNEPWTSMPVDIYSHANRHLCPWTSIRKVYCWPTESTRRTTFVFLCLC